MNKLFSTMLLIVTSVSMSAGQVKYEKEYRIDHETVPQQALDFVAMFHFDSKIKWYKEEGFNQTSLEAKTKYNGEKYSIEFDMSGAIEDIEIELKWKKFPINTRSAINKVLQSTYEKHKVVRVQSQYSGDSQYLHQTIKERPLIISAQVSLKYEMIVDVKKDGAFQELELLFSDKGELLKESKVIFKNTDNLEY